MNETIKTDPENKKQKWQNPFISRLKDYHDIIFTTTRENPQGLKEQISKKLSQHSSIILELCSGSGGHLVELAKLNPATLCIGIELRYKRLVKTAEKAKKAALENLILLQVDAENIAHILEASSCQKIYINFPDPWDGKNRWEDRYLLSQTYLSTLAKLLKDNASFNYKTDHQRRFEQVTESLKNLDKTYQITEFSEDLHNSIYNDKNILTEFERLFSSQKKAVFYLKAEKR